MRYTSAPMPPLVDAIPMLAILVLAAAIQGFFGFGFGIVAMSGLTLSQDLVHAAGVVNISGILLAGWMSIQLRRWILWRVAARVLPAMLLGVLLGVTALQQVERELMVRILGASVVGISLWNLAAPRLSSGESPLLDSGMGLLGGLLGGAFNTGGPPLVIHVYRRPESPEALKATVQGLFLAIGASRLPAAVAQGLVDGPIWRDAALAAPAALVGVTTGVALARRIDPDRFRRACWIALGLLGVGLLLSS
jgi:uncharacterized membrane protein YfcA